MTPTVFAESTSFLVASPFVDTAVATEPVPPPGAVVAGAVDAVDSLPAATSFTVGAG